MERNRRRAENERFVNNGDSTCRSIQRNQNGASVPEDPDDVFLKQTIENKSGKNPQVVRDPDECIDDRLRSFTEIGSSEGCTSIAESSGVKPIKQMFQRHPEAASSERHRERKDSDSTIASNASSYSNSTITNVSENNSYKSKCLKRDVSLTESEVSSKSNHYRPKTVSVRRNDTLSETESSHGYKEALNRQKTKTEQNTEVSNAAKSNNIRHRRPLDNSFRSETSQQSALDRSVSNASSATYSSKYYSSSRSYSPSNFSHSDRESVISNRDAPRSQMSSFRSAYVSRKQQVSIDLSTLSRRSRTRTTSNIAGHATTGVMKKMRQIAVENGVLDASAENDGPALDEQDVILDEVGREFVEKRCALYERTHRKKFQKWEKIPTNSDSLAGRWRLQKYTCSKQLSEMVKDIISWFVMWSKPLKTIEGHYGTGVVSYFVFLRWLLSINFIMALAVVISIILPYTFLKPHVANNNGTLFATDKNTNKNRSELAGDCFESYKVGVENVTQYNDNEFQAVVDFLQGTGWMELTAMFIGWYQNVNLAVETKQFINFEYISYSVPFAFLCVTVACLLLSLIMMVRYATVSVRESLITTMESLGEEEKVTQVSPLVFASWDYCLNKKEATDLKRSSALVEFKSYLTEAIRLKEQAKWDQWTVVLLWICRVCVNVIDFGVIFSCVFLVIHVTSYSLARESDGNRSFFVHFLPSITITGLNTVVPIVFSMLLRFEKLSRDNEVNALLVRRVFLRFMSLGALLYSLKITIDCEGESFNEDTCLPGQTCKRHQCWETSVGQEMYKLMMLDLIVGVLTVLLMETPIRLLVKYPRMRFLSFIWRQQFNIAARVLDLVYNQTLCWLGMFYCPLLPVITCIKYFLVFYVQKFTVLHNCLPFVSAYRASRTNTFFVLVLFASLLLAVIPFAYVVSSISPSVSCGPYQLDRTIWDRVINFIYSDKFPELLRTILIYLSSEVFTFALITILCLSVYAYWIKVAGYKHLEEVLKQKLFMGAWDKQFLISMYQQKDKNTVTSPRL